MVQRSRRTTTLPFAPSAPPAERCGASASATSPYGIEERSSTRKDGLRAAGGWEHGKAGKALLDSGNSPRHPYSDASEIPDYGTTWHELSRRDSKSGQGCMVQTGNGGHAENTQVAANLSASGI